VNTIGQRALELFSALPLDNGRRWGDVAREFQIEDAKAVLIGDRPYAFLTRSRGGSKTTDLAGCALALLLTMPARSRLYWLAADRDQGALAIDTIAGFAARTAALNGAIDVQARKVLSERTGSSLEVVPADAASAWGLNPDAIFVDELANWGDTTSARRLWEAASSAAAKKQGCRLVVLTTAGTPRHFAHEVLEHARGSALWHVNEVAGPSPWLDPEKLEEQRLRLPAAVFAQLFENRWTEAEGAFLDPAVVDAAFSLEGPALAAEPGRSGYMAGLDLGHSKDRTAFAIVHHRETGDVNLDRLQVWTPRKGAPVDFADVESFIRAAHERFRFTLRLDPWQGLDLAQRLRAAGIPAQEFNFNPSSKQKLASTLLHSLNAGKLRLYPAEGLREELLDLRVKQTASGGWTFDHDSRGHDDRAVALALALVAAIERPSADVETFSAIPVDAEDVEIEHPAGISKRGERYLDLGAGGVRVPPPGWSEAAR
jgi:hypothetical protein